MEQTNLVVTPHGKTWDQVTRDTSYLGNEVLCVGNDTQQSTDAVSSGFNFVRGLQAGGSNHKDAFIKDSFAQNFDRFICLKSGSYVIHVFTISYTGGGAGNHSPIYVNGVQMTSGHTSAAGESQTTNIHYAHLERGDHVQIYGRWYASHAYTGFWIERI